MKKAILALACMILVLGIVAAASAQEGLMDRSEWNLAANWLNVADVDIINVSGGFGKFVTPNVQVSLNGQMLDIESENLWAITPSVAYNFISDGTTNMVPFVGVGWAFVGGDLGSGDNDNGLELEAGLRVFLNGDYKTSNTAFFAKYQYINDVFGENVNLVSLGVSKFF